MHRRHLLGPAVALALTALTTLTAVTAGPALAGEGLTEHLSADLTDVGGAIACGPTLLTPVAGSLDGVFHENVDGRGRYHYTGTNVVNGGVLADSSGVLDRLVGTSSFSGTSTDPDGNDNLRFRTEVSFVVLRPDGGRLGMVRLLERVDASGEVGVVSGGCSEVGGIQ